MGIFGAKTFEAVKKGLCPDHPRARRLKRDGPSRSSLIQAIFGRLRANRLFLFVFALFFSMAEGGVDLEALQQQLADLQTQLDQQRAAQAAAANAAATNAVNAVESLQLPAFWPLAPTGLVCGN